MKTISNYRKPFFAVLAISIMTSFVLLTSCEKDDNNDQSNTYNISGAASGSQEVPANSETGTASLTGTYDANTNALMYTINWSGLTDVATEAHFYGPADVGATAGVLQDITIGTNGINGTASGTITVADSIETALLNGKIYYNIHTVLHPDGEIRGQVLLTSQ